jgi:hypothetical protein
VKSASAVESASSMESTTSVEPTSTMEPTLTMKPAVTTEPPALMKLATTAPSAITVELTTAPAIMIPVAAEPAPVPASPIVTAPVVAVIPRAGADKDSADEPIWAVVAVRRASIGVIIIVAVGAHRRWAIVSRADANADHHSLGMRKRRAKETNPQ